MSGEDAGFLSLELPIQPMHALLVAVVRPPSNNLGQPIPLTLDYVRRHVAHRLGELPSFRWRVIRVPFGLHHPVWIEDPDFDLDNHLHHVRVADPGGSAELDELCATQAEQHLDRRYPLWRLTLVDGLSDGRQAVLLAVHHCLMDAVAALVTFDRLFSGEDHEVEVEAGIWRPERVPSAARLILGAIADHRRTPRNLVRVIRKGRRGVAAAKRRQAVSNIPVPDSATDTPPSSLNRGFTLERTYARNALSLDDVTLVKEVAKVTVNDVVLAVTAGALRRYLTARDELPVRPLLAGVIVRVGAAGAPSRQSGNLISSLTTSLATDVEDPWERLRVIHQVTAESKRSFVLTGTDLVIEGLECIPPWVAEPVIRRAHRQREKHPDKANLNVVVSHFKGPAAPWELGPAIVEEAYFSGTPNNGVGVNMTFGSYAGRLMAGILCFADSMKAPEELSEALQVSLAELVARAELATSPGVRPPNR